MTALGQLSAPSRRFLALAAALLAALLALAIAMIVWRVSIAAETGRLSAALADLENRQAADAVRAGQTSAVAAFLSGNEPGLAAAQLQQRLGEVASAGGMTVNSIEVLGPESSGHANAIRISASLSGSVKSLRTVLYALETELPILLLRDVEIDAGEPAAAASNAVNVRLVVEGFMPARAS